MWKRLKAMADQPIEPVMPVTAPEPAPEVKTALAFPRMIKDIPEEASPTTVTSRVSSYRPPSIKPPCRTPMGDYIVPEGGKPLTSLGTVYPGPADYVPNMRLTKNAAPQYSVAGKPKIPNDKRQIPGPFEYNTSGDTEWKHKTITLKGRTKCYFDSEAEKSISLLGKYKVEYKNIGQGGPKFKIGQRADSDTYTGPANSLVHPVDTKGFAAPGPNYRPNSSYWGRGPKKTFGDKFKDKKDSGPGPGDYDVQTTNKGPSHSFGMKLPEPVAVQITVNKFSPAANTYNLGTTIGKAPAISITGRPSEQKGCGQTPCSSTYYPKTKTYHRYKATTLQYRWFDVNEPRKPGPADYTVNHVNLPKNPTFSCRQKVKTSYPDSVTYDKEPDDYPGPGAYTTRKNFSKNDNPAYSLRKRLEPHVDKEKFPGPNNYEPEKRDKPGSRRAPSFSMAKRLEPPNSMKDTPGPGEYSPIHRSHETDRGKYTMTSRRKSKDCYVNPVAPNKYTLPELISGKRKGVVFKSRASPYVYSGFRSEKVEEPRTLPVLAQ